MDGFYHPGISREDWIMSGTPTVIDYNHRGQEMPTFPTNQPLPPPIQPPGFSNTSFDELVQLQLQMLKSKEPLPPTNIFEGSKPQQLTSFGPPKSFQDMSVCEKYNPFVEDVNEDMEISDEEKETQIVSVEKTSVKAPENIFTESPMPIRNRLEVESGAAFYQGLILYIPPFEQLAHTYRGSPALKMLYASFEFSFKMPVKIETKARENEPNMSDATVYFKDHIISTGSGFAPHVEASVRALELLSETCYTIQAKEDYFYKCKLVDAEHMKTLNLKKWEAVSEKYPKIVDVTKDSHIQKTFAVFLDSHTTTGTYEDIVCCNLTRRHVSHIKSVVEFFQLTMLPCSISTNLSRKETPCVVSIHKYTSAKKLLDILIECGGENDKFVLHPPDTFRDFYKLHPNYWDPNQKNKPGNKILDSKTTLEDPALQALIMKPYKNVISELFEKHKSLPKVEKLSEDSVLRKGGDDFMNTFQIDMSQSKSIAPVERMQLLLNYMEQLQEYGNRLLTSGRADMIKIYHNAIDTVRKDLDECRKDIEKEQKDKEKAALVKTQESSKSTIRSRSPPSRKRTPSKKRSKSPAKKSHGSLRRSASPRRRARSKSPRKHDKTRKSPSPRRRPRSPPRRARSKSPKKPSRVSPPRRARSPLRSSPPRRVRSPLRPSPPRRVRSPLRPSPPRRRSPQPSQSFSKKDDVFISIFKDQFRRYMDILRRFRIEIEDTPIERRGALRNRMFTLREQLGKFSKELNENPNELGGFHYEIELCREELSEQNSLISGIPGLLDLPPRLSPPPSQDLVRPLMPVTYPLPTPHPLMGARIPPPPMFPPNSYGYPY